MPAGDAAVAEGLAKVAHAIRRSAALNVAMQMTPPESSVEDMLDLFERLAAAVGGKADQQESQQASRGGSEPIGVAFRDRDSR